MDKWHGDGMRRGGIGCGWCLPFFMVDGGSGNGRICRDFGFGHSFGYSVWIFTLGSLDIQNVEMRGWIEGG